MTEFYLCPRGMWGSGRHPSGPARCRGDRIDVHKGLQKRPCPSACRQHTRRRKTWTAPETKWGYLAQVHFESTPTLNFTSQMVFYG